MLYSNSYREILRSVHIWKKYKWKILKSRQYSEDNGDNTHNIEYMDSRYSMRKLG